MVHYFFLSPKSSQKWKKVPHQNCWTWYVFFHFGLNLGSNPKNNTTGFATESYSAKIQQTFTNFNKLLALYFFLGLKLFSKIIWAKSFFPQTLQTFAIFLQTLKLFPPPNAPPKLAKLPPQTPGSFFWANFANACKQFCKLCKFVFYLFFWFVIL